MKDMKIRARSAALALIGMGDLSFNPRVCLPTHFVVLRSDVLWDFAEPFTSQQGKFVEEQHIGQCHVGFAFMLTVSSTFSFLVLPRWPVELLWSSGTPRRHQILNLVYGGTKPFTPIVYYSRAHIPLRSISNK